MLQYKAMQLDRLNINTIQFNILKYNVVQLDKFDINTIQYNQYTTIQCTCFFFTRNLAQGLVLKVPYWEVYVYMED